MEEKALEFARKAHGEQLRKYSEELYIEHPKRVAETVRTVSHTTEMICAAYLHDVVEDTPVEIEEIKKKFGNKVAQLVEELTDEYVTEKYPHLNRRRRKDKEVERQATISNEAKTIKLADVIDNTPDIVKNNPSFGPKYLSEMDKLTRVLVGGDPILFEKACKEVSEGKKALNLK
ncbi:HD domain-containing protein [Salinimicrobium sediminilitoris]|uniref:HD domain-containing protein n=1 Tax=Salinimicrobium sediminilitoris TaxID=2876715 RepID=UPI001E486A2F|nr:HD domain-containing protein [Salinimicrobium sediminilitoris]MCC8359654.1 HD domain-containing protein [Salinimicrobium sediminilitoris]